MLDPSIYKLSLGEFVS